MSRDARRATRFHSLPNCLSDLEGMKHSIELLEGCHVDLGKGLGGMLPGLPF